MVRDEEHNEALLVKKAEECVQYILFCYLSQHKVIIRKADLNKHVIKEYSKLFRNIFELVTKDLHDIFGLSIIPLDNTSGKFGIRNKVF